MIRILFLFLSLSTMIFAGECEPGKECCICCVLKKRIPHHDQRHATFLKALELMRERNVQTLVETGTARYGDGQCGGDGCSTLVFSDWINHHGGILYSVDIDPRAIENARNALKEDIKNVELIEGDSIEFLKNFGQKIDFLYLDSYDFDSYNPTPSQKHHLKEVKAAYPWLTEDTIILIDDCGLAHGGKGKLVIEYLLSKGWKIVSQGYQVLLTKN